MRPFEDWVNDQIEELKERIDDGSCDTCHNAMPNIFTNNDEKYCIQCYMNNKANEKIYKAQDESDRYADWEVDDTCNLGDYNE